MRSAKRERHISLELEDLDVPRKSRAWKIAFDSAYEAAEIMTRDELKRYIEDLVASFPTEYFY